MAAERHTLLVRLDVLEVLDGLGELESTDSGGGLADQTDIQVSSSSLSSNPRGEDTYRVFLK